VRQLVTPRATRASWESDLSLYLHQNTASSSPLVASRRLERVAAVRAAADSVEPWLRFLEHESDVAAAARGSAGRVGKGEVRARTQGP
jgi:hypothetical protein